MPFQIQRWQINLFLFFYHFYTYLLGYWALVCIVAVVITDSDFFHFMNYIHIHSSTRVGMVVYQFDAEIERPSFNQDSKKVQDKERGGLERDEKTIYCR